MAASDLDHTETHLENIEVLGDRETRFYSQLIKSFTQYHSKVNPSSQVGTTISQGMTGSYFVIVNFK